MVAVMLGWPCGTRSVCRLGGLALLVQAVVLAGGGGLAAAQGGAVGASPEPASSAAPVGPSLGGSHRVYRGSEGVELSLGSFAQLVSSRNPGSTTMFGIYTVNQQQSQSATPAAGVLGTVHQSFGPLLGYNVNFGFARFTENYTSGSSQSLTAAPFTTVSSTFSRGSIGTNAFELTGAYVVHGPKGRSRFVPFAQLGGGFLAFLPTPTTQPVSYVYRGAGLAGVGVNFRISPRVHLRAEERALYFKSPDFRYGPASGVTTDADPNIPVTSRYTVAQQPTFSIVFTLGHRGGLQ